MFFTVIHLNQDSFKMWTLIINICSLLLVTTAALPFITNEINAPVVQSVIIDTDAGADDAIALLMLLSSKPNINVEAITCVRGNTGVYNVSNNVLHTLAVAKRNIPVYVGSRTGMVYSVKSDSYFGQDGFGDFLNKTPPNPYLLQKENAAIELAERVSRRPGAITIVAIGPLTNLAIASLINPRFLQQVKRIVIMGGSYKGGGTVAPGIEFNTYEDPDAAASFYIRLRKYTPTFMLPFETCSESALKMDWRLNVLGRIQSEKIKFLNLAERFVLKGKQWISCDPLAAAVLLNPKFVTNLKIGQPIVNTTTRRGAMNITFNKGSVNVITGTNTGIFKKLLLTTLS